MARMNDRELMELFPSLVEVLEAYGETLKERYREGLTQGNHNASQGLYRNISTSVVCDGFSFIVEFEGPDYMEYLEQGTGPHYPPIAPIKAWVQAKRIVPRRDDQGRLPTAQQLPYMIQQSIGKNGTKGYHIFETANALTAQEWDALIDQAVEEDISRNIEGILKVLGMR